MADLIVAQDRIAGARWRWLCRLLACGMVSILLTITTWVFPARRTYPVLERGDLAAQLQLAPRDLRPPAATGADVFGLEAS